MKKAVCFMMFLLTALLGINICCAQETSDGYLIRLKSEYSYEEFIQNKEIEIESVADKWNIYKIPDDDVEKVDLSKVEYIEPNVCFELMNVFPNDTFYSLRQTKFLNMINVPYVWENNFWGENIKVAVIDSGISEEHPDLKNRIAKTINYTNTETINEEEPHGSSVAGIIGAEINNNIGIAGISKADLYIMKVVENKTVGLDVLIKAIADAVEVYNCDIINLSLGTDNISEAALYSLTVAANKAYENGTIVVASAGNTGHKNNLKCYPASLEHIISVAAVNENGESGYFSQYNNMVDVAAPGVDVYSTSKTGYAYVSGTSFAAPHIAGVLALVKSIRPSTNQDDAELMIKYSSSDAGGYGYDVHYGWGIVNAEKMMKIASGRKPFLYPSYITYDDKSKSVKVSYLNTAQTVNRDSQIRMAIYDRYNKLEYISHPVNVDIASFAEREYIFDNAEIPSGGSVKIFCTDKKSILTPSAESAVFNN